MAKNTVSTKSVYLHVYECEEESGETWLNFEIVTAHRFRHDNVSYVGLVRGSVRVTAFSSYTLGMGAVSKRELRAVAKRYLDGDYTTTMIDFRS